MNHSRNEAVYTSVILSSYISFFDALQQQKGGEEMKVVAPSVIDAAKILGKSANVAHAAKCGTCACMCACRYDVKLKKAPW